MIRPLRPLTDILLLSALAILSVVSLVGLVLPSILVVISSFNPSDLLKFPPDGFSLRWYVAMLDDWEIRQAALLSFRVAITVVLLDLLIGVPAAFPLVRSRFRGRDLLKTFLVSPLTIPHLVIGVGLLFFYIYLGLPLGFVGLVAAHVVVTLPFVLSITIARLTIMDISYEEAAMSLGANQVQKFFHVVLPQIWPGIAAGAAFAFLISFDEFTISLFTSSDRSRPLPVVLFSLLRFHVNPVVGAVSSVEIVFALVVLMFGARLLGLSRIPGLKKDI